MNTTPSTLRQTYRSSVDALVTACRAGNTDRAESLLYSTKDLISAMPTCDRAEALRHLRATMIDLRIQGNLPKTVAKIAG